jgi:hypothetical protein
MEAVGVAPLKKGITRETFRRGDPVKIRYVLKMGAMAVRFDPLHGDQARGHGVEVQW